ncbi:MAG: hypothetical protein ABW003_06675 [Microvirga sp.]
MDKTRDGQLGNAPYRTRWLSPRRLTLAALFLALYLLSTIPVGLALYSLKSAEGIDLFKQGGFHTYMQCLRTSVRRS